MILQAGAKDFLKLHNHVVFEFCSPQLALTNNALECTKTKVVFRLFEHLKSDCKPIFTKSRKHFVANEEFIAGTTGNNLQMVLSNQALCPVELRSL